jgi:hypothetical protein
VIVGALRPVLARRPASALWVSLIHDEIQEHALDLVDPDSLSAAHDESLRASSCPVG